MAVRRAIAIFFWVIGALVLAGGALFIWLLKDGLGPDAVDSQWQLALIRFGRGMAEIAGWFLLPLLAGCLIYPWRNREGA